MHPGEPLDPRAVTPPSAPPPLGEAWRDEIASRVNNYRARRSQDAEPLVLDFGPSAAESTAAEQSRVAGDKDPAQAHDAFDTRYYRRLNAQAMEQCAATPAPLPQAEPNCDPGPARLDVAEAGAAKLCFDLDLQEWPDNDPPLPHPGQQEARMGHPIAGAPHGAWQEAAKAGAIGWEASDALAAPAGRARSKLVFPRTLLEPPLMPLPSRDELAEPVHARPRILEVPEDIIPAMQGSLFPEIRLDADDGELSQAQEGEFELPLQVAPVPVRVSAAVADLAVVLAAMGIFVAIAEHALPDMPHAKPFWMAMGAAAVLFWAVYQAMFLLYVGRTLGMSMNRLRLSTFDGRPPLWHERRRRAAFTIVSFVSVALGFLWALVDEDTLCWHDRVSQTFPTTE
jgi:uncharacterized RDD family membrane protein YckC